MSSLCHKGRGSESGSRQVVLINEMEEQQVNEIKFKFQEDLEIDFVRGDFTNEAVLRRANVQDAASVVIVADISGGREYQKADERVENSLKVY